MNDNAKLYINAAQQETASLSDPNTLLARDVYDRLYMLISEAQQEASKALRCSDHDFDSLRAHNAVLIDGARGSGKSTVLVNLPAYLKQKTSTPYSLSNESYDSAWNGMRVNKDLLAQVHILKPVDPTLLEEHDDLFLHVIVAAVLSDNLVQQARHEDPNYRSMLRALEELAFGLESVDAQKEERGLDKLRSFIGNRQLNSKVHAFFRSVLTLLGKDLLVLPIDDVDTALDRAYENLEIVRRYLNTPLVLPIISGDMDLYYEVIWREFHGKIVNPTPQYKEDEANRWAIQLASEYQRKILPVPNRMRMPDIATYLSDFQIEIRNLSIGQYEGRVTSLGAFHAWLEGFIAGPVNALENSQLALPIPSIRALTQLIRRCGQDHLLEKLPLELRQAQSTLAARRAAQIAPGIRSEMVDQFNINYAEAELAKDRDFRPVYKSFSDVVRQVENTRNENPQGELQANDTVQLSKRLREQFGSEREAGPTCLVLEAMQHWYGNSEPGSSVFDTALFQPLRHTDTLYKDFRKQDNLANWAKILEKQLPRYWLEEIGKREVLLPYPLPETGRWGQLSWDVTQSAESSEGLLLLRLLTHHNYYSESSRGTKLNIGRLFELLVTSLVRDVSASDVVTLLDQVPFYSTSMLAPTKTQSFISSDLEDYDDISDTDLDPKSIDAINTLVDEISAWRNSHQLKQVRFSPWLIYNMFNKVFNQAQIFNGNQRIDKPDNYAKTAFETGLHAFYSIWSASGSFEKGPLFGLPARISTVNLRKTSSFEKNSLFRQNILPFFPQGGNMDSDVTRFGKAMRAVTYYLGNHPLRTWLENSVKTLENNDSFLSMVEISKENESRTNEQANRQLRELLGVSTRKGNISNNILERELRKLSLEKAQSVYNEMRVQFPDTECLLRLEKAYRKIFNELSSES
ncbi:antiviral RADAR system adenosine triphosphatase RdrA [Rahnella inusitata]|uniref:antiviral RADAR system adenosine triphosphatase RdrA n=1 Tax=Rahnella inusitata TaxID=58169 RepID=UPI000DD4A4F7|nr:antiviral RADAR system adenosine triphosphatase RdrA [Rahnella inusitata]